MKRRILILGGTTEARALALSLAHRDDLVVTLSLAGRTAAPLAQPVPVRRGGFGGVQGLAEYLRANQIDVLIDATHPYAQMISANAQQAAMQTSIPILVLRRPPWRALDGDRWTEIDDAQDAVRALGTHPLRVFLALGRQEIAPFAQAPQHHYLIRSVDPIDPPLPVPHARYVCARGPFEESQERELLVSNRIEVMVAKNSGGASTYGKIIAARSLGLPVLLFKRPLEPDGPFVYCAQDAVAWLDHALGPEAARGV